MISYAKNVILNYKDEIDDKKTKHNSKGILISKCKDVYQYFKKNKIHLNEVLESSASYFLSNRRLWASTYARGPCWLDKRAQGNVITFI